MDEPERLGLAERKRDAHDPGDGARLAELRTGIAGRAADISTGGETSRP